MIGNIFYYVFSFKSSSAATTFPREENHIRGILNLILVANIFLGLLQVKQVHYT